LKSYFKVVTAFYKLDSREHFKEDWGSNQEKQFKTFKVENHYEMCNLLGQS